MPISATSFSATSPTAYNGSRSKELGQDAFLRLMTEQLKNQDPLKPLASNEFLGQLAQFTSVQSLQSLNDRFASLAASLEGDQALQAAALVGRNAMIASDSISLGSEGGAQVEVDAPGPGMVTLEITNANGALVRRIEVPSTGAGPLALSWDGNDATGSRVRAGDYSIRATYDGEAGRGALETLVATRIDSVSIGIEGLMLNLAGHGALPLSAVRRIG